MADCTGRKRNKRVQQYNSSFSSNSESDNSDTGNAHCPCGENDTFGFTLNDILKFLIAAQSDDVETLQQFLKRGVQVDTRCLMFRDTGLHKACRTGAMQATRLLLDRGADITKETEDGQSALHIAVINNQPDIIHMLLSYGACIDIKTALTEVTPLMLAASMANTTILTQLIQAGSSINMQDCSGMSALHHCFNYYQQRREFIAHSVDCAQLLVEAGANMGIRDHNFKTPLTWAMEKMNMRGVKYFLAQNIDPDSHHLHYSVNQHLPPLVFAIVKNRQRLGNLLWYAGATCQNVWSNDEPFRTLMAKVDLSPFSFSQPRTLKEVSRKCIRDQLRSCGVTGQKFRDSVESLSIPTSVKDYILLKDCLDL